MRRADVKASWVVSAAWAAAMQLMSTPAWADEERPVSAILSVTSDYRFRGIRQNDGRPAPQGEIDWRPLDSWSIGVFASSVNFRDHENTSMELDVFVARHFAIDTANVDLAAYYYSYPNHDRIAGHARYSTFEVDGVWSRTFGPATLSGTLAWSPNFFAGSGVATYVGLGASRELFPWLNMSAHIGRQWVQRWDSAAWTGYPYDHWDLGVTASYRGASFDLRYTDTSLSEAQCALTQGRTHWCQAGLIVTLSYAV